MRIHNLKNWIGAAFLLLLPLLTTAQHEDCRTAYVICSDSSFAFLPNGRGIDDFANPNNDEGCLVTRENISAWFYFELREDMPLDSNQLGFVITDTVPGYFIDYDFAIYGPNLNCDSLGSPYRCSFARLPNNGNLRGSVVKTGFSEEATDTTEGFADLNSDGFIKPMEVAPGNGYYLVIDFFVSAFPGGNLEEFDSTAIQGFRFDWLGSAKPWLNCIVNPNCDQVTLDIGEDMELCAGTSYQFPTQVTNTAGNESYIWTEANGRTDLLSDPSVPSPTLTIPPGFVGTLEYTLLVKEGACEHERTVTIQVITGPVPTITGDSVVCEGELTTLSVQSGFDSYEWSTGETSTSITVPGGQTYRVTVTTTGTEECPGIGEYFVREAVAPRPLIRGNNGICQDGRTDVILRGAENYDSYLWDDGTTTSNSDFFVTSDTGLVFLTVTDSIGCPTTDSTRVILNPDPVPTFIGDGVLCDGTLDTISVADSFLEVDSWSGGGRIVDINQRELEVDAPGTYTAMVQDTLGCFGQGDFEVVSRPNPAASISGDPEFCSNVSTILSAPDLPGLSYQWSTGDTTRFVEVDSAFRLGLRVINEFGCFDTSSIQLDTLPLPRPAFTGNDYFCVGESTTLTANAPQAQAFAWSTGDSVATLAVDMVGTYTVTITDANGCVGSGPISVTERQNPVPPIVGETMVCPEETITIRTTLGFASYNWSTGSTNTSTDFTGPGLLTLSVVDTFGCPGIDSIRIDTFTSPVPLITGDTAFCEGESGILIGELGYTSYEWPDGSVGTTYAVDSGGLVTLMVVDQNGCPGENTILVDERPAPVPAIDGATNFCANESTTFTAEAGFVSYVWSTGDNQAEVTIDQPGTYTVSVVDNVGCEGSGQIVADTLPLPQPRILGGDFICEGGQRLLFTDQFTEYRWSTGDSTGATQITMPGTYSVTVTDFLGCTNSVEKDIRSQPNPVPRIQGDNILCPGETTTLRTTEIFEFYEWSNGSFDSVITTGVQPEIWVSVIDSFGCEGFDTIPLIGVQNPLVEIGGQLDICDGDGAVLQATPGYVEYLWSTGSDSTAIIESVDGIYSVTVTDANGCQASDSEQLTVNANPKPEITGDTSACENVGTTLSVRQNFLDYQWSTGETTDFIEVFESGEVIVEVSSPGGCTNSDTVQVEIFTPRNSPINNAILDACEGGTLDLDAGPGFLRYTWSSGQMSRQISVPALDSVYNLVVIDSNQCRSEASIVIRGQPLPRPNIIAPDVFCRGTPVTLLASGSYRTYDWSTGDRGDVLEITQGGRYDLTVTDNNGCQGTTFVDLAERDAPDIEILGDVKICTGDTTTLSVRDDYLYYAWTDDSNSNSIQVTRPGSYGVLVVGENGCANSDQVQVLFRPDPLPRISGDLTLCSANTGILDAGGDYVRYEWDTGDTTRQIEIDTGRIYTVRVVDDFGCDNIARVPVREVPSPTVQINDPGGICPADTVTLQIDSAFASVSWSTGAIGQDIRVALPGTYRVEVIDTNNCNAIDSVNLVRYMAPDFNLTGDTVFCEGETVRIALDRIFPEIQWSTGETGTSIFVDTTGDYGVRVTNAVGCSTEKSRFVLSNPAPPALPGPDTLLNCYFPQVRLGRDSASYPVPVELSWTGPGLAPAEADRYQPLVDRAGTYILETRDLLTGCPSLPDTVEVENIQFSPAVAVATDGRVNCTTGTAVLSGAGTLTGPGIGYEWVAVENDSLVARDQLSVMVDRPLTYRLTVFDTLTGCRNADSLLMEFDPELPSAVIGPTEPINCRQPTETLMAAPAPVGSSWSFAWVYAATPSDTLRGEEIVVNREGNYYLIVENDGNGCTDLDSVLLTRNDTIPDISAGPDIELDCNMPEVQLGEPFQRERWLISWTKAGDPDFVTAQKRPVVQEAGVYQLEVFDPLNGCVNYDTVEVTVYENLPELVNFNVRPEDCFGDNNGELLIGQVIGGEGPYLYRLNRGDFVQNTEIRNLSPGRYNLVVQDIRGCELDTTLIIAQGLDPLIELGEDRYIRQGEYVRLSALTNVDEVATQSLRWTQPDTLSCDTCAVQRLAPLQTGEYIATVVDTNGCRATDSVMVFVDRTLGVYIPNAFSPNGDGYNDRITVFSSNNVRRVVRFLIFDRGGDQVFQRENFPTNDLSLGWDGFHRGRLMNSQVFSYFAEVELADGEVVFFEGGIHLIR